MSQAEDIRLETRVGNRHHQDGRPFHYPSLSQEDRIRRIFGLPEETPLPSVNDQSLATYFDYLVSSLSLPFDALFCQNGGEMRQLIHYVTVMEMTDPRQARNHSLHGILCVAQNTKESLHLPLAELGVRDDNPNCQLIDDYAYWFVNCRR
jgi:hypothetical protein